MEIIVKGQISGIKKSAYKGVESHKIQFISHTENGIDLIDVKVEEEFFSDNLKKGVEVIAPIKISAMDSKVFYKVISPIKFNK